MFNTVAPTFDLPENWAHRFLFCLIRHCVLMFHILAFLTECAETVPKIRFLNRTFHMASTTTDGCPKRLDSSWRLVSTRGGSP